MSSKKAVLWDLDGTIIDSVSVMHATVNEIFPKVGIEPITREHARSHLYGRIDESIARMSSTFADQERLLKLFLETQLANYDDPLTHDGIHEAIAGFGEKGFKQAIVTSRHGGPDKAGAHNVVKALKLDLHIDTVISADETINHKPHPEPILKALEILGVAPENAVMIGDQPVDVEAARSAGVKSIFIDHEQTEESKETAKTSQPDIICSNAAEIIDGVGKLLGV